MTAGLSFLFKSKDFGIANKLAGALAPEASAKRRARPYRSRRSNCRIVTHSPASGRDCYVGTAADKSR